MTTNLLPLTPREAVEFDHDVLERLCLEHGHNAEAVIARMLQHIEHDLKLAESQVRMGETRGLMRTCHDLIDLSRKIGMHTLETAATAVIDCLSHDRGPALAACAQRMLRLGRPETIDHWTVGTGTVA